MRQPSVPLTQTATTEPAARQEQDAAAPAVGHTHDRSCYWDLRVCRWVCATEAGTEPA